MGHRGVDTPGGVARRVGLAVYIPRVDASEDIVDLQVLAVSFPPSLNDANVVTEDLEVRASRSA
jgi:hypothetical protein